MEDLKILKKVYDMLVYGYHELESFPKSVRFTLVEHIQRLMDDVMDGVIEAQKKYYKKTSLQELDVNVTKLKMYLRLSLELGYLSPGRYKVWNEKLLEIGRMVGGWLKSVYANEGTKQPRKG